MKTIGLIGGMSWESTVPYYSLINRGINQKLGGNHSAKCILYSFDFQEIQELQYSGDWELLREKMTDAGRGLKKAGADFIVLCTNTMHKVMDSFETDAGIPLLHIADAVGERIDENGMKRIGLLGTVFTMEQEFYKERLRKKFGFSVVIPEAEDRKIINDVIYKELAKGILLDSSRREFERIMEKMKEKGAEGIILGCTEIGMLIKTFSIPLFDSGQIHAEKAVEMCL